MFSFARSPLFLLPSFPSIPVPLPHSAFQPSPSPCASLRLPPLYLLPHFSCLCSFLPLPSSPYLFLPCLSLCSPSLALSPSSPLALPLPLPPSISPSFRRPCVPAARSSRHSSWRRSNNSPTLSGSSSCYNSKPSPHPNPYPLSPLAPPPSHPRKRGWMWTVLPQRGCSFEKRWGGVLLPPWGERGERKCSKNLAPALTVG